MCHASSSHDDDFINCEMCKYLVGGARVFVVFRVVRELKHTTDFQTNQMWCDVVSLQRWI